MIQVIDSIMGSGKTSWAMQYINENSDRNFLYITPFLSECERVRAALNRPAHLPRNIGAGKIDDLKQLIRQERDIISTHKLFLDFDAEVYSLLKDFKYTLIIDEAVSCLLPFNDLEVEGEKYGRGDILRLETTGIIKVDPASRKVNWLYQLPKELESDSFNYKYLKKYAQQGTLYSTDKFFVWVYPAAMFELFENVFILTYLFEGSVMSGYCKIFQLDYIKKSIACDNGRYTIEDWKPSDNSKYKDLIEVYYGSANHNFGECKDGKRADPKRTALSKNWFGVRNSKNPEVEQMQKNIKNMIYNVWSASATDILWTCYKVDYQKLAVKGIKGKKDPAANTYPIPFLAVNARSSNEYSDRHYLIYLVNRYLNTVLSDYFNYFKIDFDLELFALSELLQWIFRSAIRNNEKVYLYLPSKRMRELLEKWLQK